MLIDASAPIRGAIRFAAVFQLQVHILQKLGRCRPLRIKKEFSQTLATMSIQINTRLPILYRRAVTRL